MVRDLATDNKTIIQHYEQKQKYQNNIPTKRADHPVDMKSVEAQKH